MILTIYVLYFSEHILFSNQVAPSAPAVDVRDVALSHLQSLLIEKAGGNRFAITKRE